MTQFQREFTDPEGYEAAIKAAEELGFTATEFRLHGSWEAEGEPFYGDYVEEVEKTGSKYFYLRMDVDDYDREVWRCEPVSGGATEDGKLVVHFDDGRL